MDPNQTYLQRCALSPFGLNIIIYPPGRGGSVANLFAAPSTRQASAALVSAGPDALVGGGGAGEGPEGGA